MGTCSSLSEPFPDPSLEPSPEHSSVVEGRRPWRRKIHFRQFEITSGPVQHESPNPSPHGSFESVPPEVLLQIFSRCQVQSYPTLRLVCRSWRDQLTSAKEVQAVRSSNRISEQWVVISSSEGDYEPFKLKIRAFHCQSKTWHTLGVPKQIATLGPGFAMAAVGHKLFLTGGTTGRYRRQTAATWCYDLFLKTWQQKAPMVTPRRFHAMGNVCGKLVVAGGEVPGLDDFCLSEIYDPDSDTWHEIPDSGLPAKLQEGWVVNSTFCVRHLPDRVYKISLPDTCADSGAEERPLHSSCSMTERVRFQVSPYKKQADPVLAGMDYVTSAEGRVYGCMISSHLSSIGVFNERSRAWHLLIGNGMTFHRIFERFDGLVCGGGCLFIVTKDNALLQVTMEDRGTGLGGPEWLLLSQGVKQVRYRWRRFACLEL